MMYTRTLILLAYFMLECTGQAISQQPHTTHDHDHNHDHGHNHDHAPVQQHDHAHPAHKHVHNAHVVHEHVHDHGHEHSHVEYSIGVLGARSAHNASFNSLPPIENCCTGFSNSSGIGFGLQAGVTLPISNDGWLLSSRIGYQSVPVAFDSYSTEKAFTGGVVSGTALFQHTLDVDWSVLSVGASVEYPVLDMLFLGAGLEGMFYATGRFHQTETLIEPTNLVFETGTPVRLDRVGYVRGNNDVVVNATLSGRLRLLDGSKSNAPSLDAFARYSLPLSPLFDKQQWQGMYGNPPARFYIDNYTITMLTIGLGLIF